ncbi:MAG: secretin N-terminal domain-containing protein [Sulfuricellaceae bacterium]|nr:secretin N-terminal domain-containing protein [Sulfuricellaceae bacterium]
MGACTVTQPIIPEPLLRPRAETHPEELVQELTVHGKETAQETRVQNTPKPPPAGKLSTITPAAPVVAAKEEANITVAFDQLPLPQFVQAVYGLILKKNYSLDPLVASRKDLVTLRAAQMQTPGQIETAARMLLKTYGVTVTDLGAGNYRITPDNAQTGYAPEILRGRALPEVPLPLRPIYQLVELESVRSSEVINWLSKIFGSKVTILDDSQHNTLILSGQSDDVTAVLAAIHVLDQPLMKGRQSRRINPVFWSADELGKKLNDILTAEGYSVTNAPGAAGQFPINLIPIQGVNALIVFASDPAVMQHIIDWAKDLDKPNTSKGSGGGYFTYQARYTNAENLAKTMQSVLGEAAAAPQQLLPAGATVIGTPAAPSKSGRVIVNIATNTLIFQGSSENHTQLLNLLQELDKPAKTALIEVTVAEVALDNTTQLGVEWAFNASGAEGRTIVGGTKSGIPLGSAGASSGIGVGTAGLVVGMLNSSGDLRLLLNMLATSSKANVLSTPRILARSGETATIQVGSEIPTITGQQTSSATAGTGVIQSVQYRKTGIILNVKPVIYAGDRIDLDVTQEVSDSTKVGVAGSPIIDTRKVETRLSLKDGTPVLLGGLIQQNNTRTETGVPWLKDLPVAGQLFRTNTDNNRKTELLVLITPYIVADDHDAQEITDAFRNQLGEWANTRVPSAPPPKKASSPPLGTPVTPPTAPEKSDPLATPTPAP